MVAYMYYIQYNVDYILQVADSSMLKVKFAPTAVLEDVQPIRCAAFHPNGKILSFRITVSIFAYYNFNSVISSGTCQIIQLFF